MAFLAKHISFQLKLRRSNCGELVALEVSDVSFFSSSVELCWLELVLSATLLELELVGSALSSEGTSD